MAVLVSVAIIATTLLICDLARNRIGKNGLGSLSLGEKILLDAILTIELCAPALEFGVIFQHYGVAVWTIGLYANCLYQLFRWRGLTSPTPYAHLVDWLSGTKTLGEVVVRSGLLLVFGVLTHRIFIGTIWSWEMSSLHTGRHLATSAGVCVYPWQSIPVLQSVLAEFAGTLFLGVVIRLVSDNPTLANNDPKYAAAIIAALICVTIHAALEVSGGMFNPMLASVLVAGCKGHSMLDHILIYWAGGTMGAIAGHWLYPKIQSIIYPQAQKGIYHTKKFH